VTAHDGKQRVKMTFTRIAPSFRLGRSSSLHSRTLACSHTAACSHSTPFYWSPSRNSRKYYYSFADPGWMEGWVGL